MESNAMLLMKAAAQQGPQAAMSMYKQLGSGLNPHERQVAESMIADATGVQLRNMGGVVYRQAGGGVPTGVPAEVPQQVPNQLVSGPQQVTIAPPPTTPQPQIVQVPQPKPKKNLIERIAEAKDALEGKRNQMAFIDVTPSSPAVYDAQGQGPVFGNAVPAPSMVGPDIGADTVDLKATPGEFVVNAEATEMFRPEIEAMNNAGLAARNMGGMIDTPVYRQEGGPIFEKGKLGNVAAFLQSGLYGQPDPSLLVDDPRTAKAKLEGEQRAQAYRDSIDAASKAKSYIQQGAGKVIDYIANNYSNIVENIGLGTLLSNPGSAIQAGAQLLSGERKNALLTAANAKFAGTKEANAYELYLQEISLLELKARSLVKGGSISDSEGAKAAETIVTARASSDVVQLQLDTVIQRNNQGLETEGFSAYTPTAAAHKVSGEPYKESNDTSTRDVDEVVEDTADTIKGTAEATIDVLKDWGNELFNNNKKPAGEFLEMNAVDLDEISAEQAREIIRIISDSGKQKVKYKLNNGRVVELEAYQLIERLNKEIAEREEG